VVNSTFILTSSKFFTNWLAVSRSCLLFCWLKEVWLFSLCWEWWFFLAWFLYLIFLLLSCRFLFRRFPFGIRFFLVFASISHINRIKEIRFSINRIESNSIEPELHVAKKLIKYNYIWGKNKQKNKQTI
jgi:hypothetical protein